MIHATGQSIKSCGIQQTRTSRLLKLLIILMLSVNLKVILGKRSKPLTSLLAVAPTIHWMIPLFPILVTFLMLFITIFQQFGAALPMTFVQMIIIIWCYEINVRPPVRTDAGGGDRESDFSPSGKEYVIAEVKFSISSNSLVSAVNHMAARTFRGKKNNNDKNESFFPLNF